jgi:arylsulfatase A-like enzyme
MTACGKPNVVVFFTDQQRWDCSSLHGNPLDLMLNFDRVAQRATHLANSFTCQPVCGPARSCLQTGRYATQTGVWKNGFGLKKDAVTLADCFNQAGYHTGYIGKWHLAGISHEPGVGGIVPRECRAGYQEWLGVEALEFSRDEYHAVLYDNDNREHQLPGYRVDALADAGIRFQDRHKDQPFFLMMSFIEPHHQNDRDDYPAPEGYRERYAGRWVPPDLAALPAWSTTQNQKDAADYRCVGGTTQRHLGGYYGMVKRLDEAFGRVLDALTSLGLEQDTIVLFTSDHGSHFKTRNAEYKRSCHEASVHVPTLLAGPGFEGGGRRAELISLVDLPPTLLDACGLPVPETMEGRSILPLLRGRGRDWPDDVFIQISESQTGRAVRTHRWKYSVSSADTSAAAADTYKEEFLYDLHYDPYELCNLIHAQSHAKVREVMRQRLLKYIQRIEGVTPAIERAEERPSGQWHVSDDEVLQ